MSLVTLLRMIFFTHKIAFSWMPLNLANGKSPSGFSWWLGAIRKQAITWANVDPDLSYHMVSLGYKIELKWSNMKRMYPKVLVWWSIMQTTRMTTRMLYENMYLKLQYMSYMKFETRFHQFKSINTNYKNTCVHVVKTCNIKWYTPKSVNHTITWSTENCFEIIHVFVVSFACKQGTPVN